MPVTLAEPAAYFCTACQEAWSFRTQAEEARAAVGASSHECPAEPGGSGWVVDLAREEPYMRTVAP